MLVSTVGIIANPASGKDIRRLVAHGTVFDNMEKVSIVRRIILACDAVGIKRILYMPDYYGIVPKALRGIGSRERVRLRVEAVPMELTGTQADSQTAAALMCRECCGCIVTLGGDGTNRMVAKGSGDIPLVPVSTGTNNVFPSMLEATPAGLAAAVTALGIVPESVFRAKRLAIRKEGVVEDIALVDAVVLDEPFIGARAVWHAENIEQAVLTRGEAHNIGIASILGGVRPVRQTDPFGAALRFGPPGSGKDGKTVVVPIAPGLFRKINIVSLKSLPLGHCVPVRDTPCIIALDGEREVIFEKGEEGDICLDLGGPLVTDARQALRHAAEQGFFEAIATGFPY